MSPLTHYVVIRRDLTFGEYSAQLAHAGEAYALRRDIEANSHQYVRLASGEVVPVDERAERFGDTSELRFNETTAIVKGIRNEARLLKLEKQLVAAGVPHVAIREDLGERGGRLAGQLTCISLMPAEREKVEPFVREIHTIDRLDGPAGLCAACAADQRMGHSHPACGQPSCRGCTRCYRQPAPTPTPAPVGTK